MSWVASIAREIAEHGAVVRVTVICADGSTPRETGAAMQVSAGDVRDTIGGGALELEAIAHARGLLASPSPRFSRGKGTWAAPWQRDVRDFALGPSLGQCCGGHTRLLFEVFTRRERPHLEALAGNVDANRALLLRPLESEAPLQVAVDRREHREERPLAVTRAARDMLSGARARMPSLIRGGRGEAPWFVEPFAPRTWPLYIYGAGHVGRALVRVLEDLPFVLTWVDTAAARFPESVPPHAKAHVAPDPSAFAGDAAADAFHIVLTYSHALDLAICHSLLRRDDARFVGLIGSRTKRARFVKRLGELGLGDAQIARLTCPIGIAGLPGKEPAKIAVAGAAQLVQLADASRASSGAEHVLVEDSAR